MKRVHPLVILPIHIFFCQKLNRVDPEITYYVYFMVTYFIHPGVLSVTGFRHKDEPQDNHKTNMYQ